MSAARTLSLCSLGLLPERCGSLDSYSPLPGRHSLLLTQGRRDERRFVMETWAEGRCAGSPCALAGAGLFCASPKDFIRASPHPMNRSHLFDYIEGKLNSFAYRIESRGKLNILDLNIHAETFYAQLFNLLFGWDLVNVNQFDSNAEAVDLMDSARKLLAQVSSVATKQKIADSLRKNLSAYADHSFHFISICKDASKLRTEKYITPQGLSFNPDSNIHDITSILKVALYASIEMQTSIADFLRQELVTDIAPQRVESSLATVVGILAKADLSQVASPEVRPFGIEEKLSFNSLVGARSIVREYVVHHSRLDAVYKEFDKLGVNKSLAVLEQVRREYWRFRGELNGDVLFFRIVTRVIERCKESANYSPLPIEELELCAYIIIVDAFIRCKIFENPVTDKATNAPS